MGSVTTTRGPQRVMVRRGAAVGEARVVGAGQAGAPVAGQPTSEAPIVP